MSASPDILFVLGDLPSQLVIVTGNAGILLLEAVGNFLRMKIFLIHLTNMICLLTTYKVSQSTSDNSAASGTGRSII